MDMRVDGNPEGRVGKGSNRLQRLFGDLPVLRIDHQDAVGSEQHHHPSAGRIRVRGIEGFRSVKDEQVRRHLRRDHDPNLVPRRFVARGKRVGAFSRRDELNGITGFLRHPMRGQCDKRRDVEQQNHASHRHRHLDREATLPRQSGVARLEHSALSRVRWALE